MCNEGCRVQHELASRSSGEAAPPPPHHARRLSRFGLEAVPRRSDSTSSMPPGHSRRSSVSELSTGAYSEAESVGSLVRRSSDPDIQVKYPPLHRKPAHGLYLQEGQIRQVWHSPCWKLDTLAEHEQSIERLA